MLFLVPRALHQVHEQERLHYGESLHFFKVHALHNFILYIYIYIYNYHITAYIFNVDSFICLTMKANVEPVLSRNRLTERRNALTFIVWFWFMSSDFNIWEEFLFLSARCFLPVNEERYEVKLCTAATFIMWLSRCEAARTLSHTHTHTPVQKFVPVILTFPGCFLDVIFVSGLSLSNFTQCFLYDKNNHVLLSCEA